MNSLINNSELFISEVSNYDFLEDLTFLNSGTEELNNLSKKARMLSENSVALISNIKDCQSKTNEEYLNLIKQKQNLEKGINSFPDYVIRLREILCTEISIINKNFKANILSEIIEIKNDRWRNAIEGYLNTQKFYILVEPEDFKVALQIYNKVKDTQKISGVGLVDIEKIMKKNPVCEEGSLAEEIITNDEHAQLYINYLLGKVMKCNSVDESRNFSTSITDEGMLYQGYVARRINPKLWQRPTIGQGSIAKQLVIIEEDILRIKEKDSKYVLIKKSIDSVGKLVYMSENDSLQIIEAIKSHSNLDVLKAELRDTTIKLKNIDVSSIKALEEEKLNLEIKIKECENKFEDIVKENSTLENKCKLIDEEKIPEVNDNIDEVQDIISKNYSLDWVSETGNLRYEKELFKKSSNEIEQNFKSNLTEATNKKIKEWENVRDLRNEYNYLFKAGHDVDNPKNNKYEEEWNVLSEIKLPEYQVKINDAKEKAYERFRMDFLSRLHNNIKEAESQIKKLNAVIKGHYLGDEVYRFHVYPNPVNEKFYNMITDSILLEGYNIMTGHYNAKYKDILEEFFKLITENGEDYERRVKEYTNYRTYLSFDLEITNKEGKKQMLSKTLGKKSGGETQTPFYLSVLVSFAQIYRLSSDKSNDTIRLIVFDEAFSRMDENRISKSIELLKKFDLQVILSAPSNRVPEISRLVDKTIVVSKENNHSCTTSFGKEG